MGTTRATSGRSVGADASAAEKRSRVRPAYPPRIALVGLMGSGKTTVGRALARRLGYDFVDMDLELARRARRSVARIFEQEGEEGFRRREATLLSDLARATGVVVSTGGGVVTLPENRLLLVERFRSIWLKIAPATAWRRLGTPAGRPMLSAAWLGATPQIRLRHLARLRNPLYAEVGLPVPAGREPEVMVGVIAKALRDADAR